MFLSYNTWVRSSSCALVVFVLLSWLMLFGQQEEPAPSRRLRLSPWNVSPDCKSNTTESMRQQSTNFRLSWERKKHEMVEVVLNILDLKNKID